MNAGARRRTPFVVLKQGARADERELREFARANLAQLKALHSVTFVNELPKTATGKIQKYILRAQQPAIAPQRSARWKKSRWDCPSLLEKERDDRENRVEDERRDREGAIGRGRPAQEGVAGLNQDQRRNENDDADFPRDRAVAFQINDRAQKKNSHLQCKFDASMSPKTETDLHRVVIDGEIGTMNNQIEKPMRKNGETHEQRRAVRGNVAPADFVNCKCYRRPEERAEEAVRVRHVIKIERISRGDSRNETHLLDPKQNKWRPQKIQQLHGHEQNPERDLISRRFDRERNAVMPDEHYCSVWLSLLQLSICGLLLEFFADFDLARFEIDFLELRLLQIPNCLQLGRPMRPSGQVRFVVGKDIEQQLVLLEFQLFHIRV